MPTVNVRRSLLFSLIGRTFTDAQFDDLCFQYGIELDSVTTEAEISGKQTAADAAAAAAVSAAAGADEGDAAVVYKIEIPANRYDLLCVEGISRALRVFLQIEPTGPNYRVLPPAGGAASQIRIIQSAATRSIRPFVVGAVLRGVTFTPDSYASFIDLQDKLHQNIGRKRTLVAIGTHDLDTVRSPFRYDALPKKDITFIPLGESREFDGEALFEYYNTKSNPPSHLKPYLYITESSPVQPVIFDADKRVCSLPPIINGEHSKITLNTKNVFIEVVTMFSQYCADKFTVEGVEVVDEESHSTKLCPDLSNTQFTSTVGFMNSSIGIKVTGEDMVQYLKKMSMESTLQGEVLTVQVPPTRSDVLSHVDLMEDIAISYGFNAIPKTMPQCYTVGAFQPLNALSDSLREQVAQAGFNEVLTWVLLSFDDNYRFMQPKDVQGQVMDIKAAAQQVAGQTGASQLLDKPLVVHELLRLPHPITLSNPKSLDFQLVRTTLLPGLLKALANNQGQVNLPIKLFECGDIGFQAEDTDVGAKNQRRIGALYCDLKSGFEIIQGLLDRIMEVNGVRFGPSVVEHRAQRARMAEKRKVAEAAEKKKAAAAAAAKAKAAKKGGAAAAAPSAADDAAAGVAAAPADDGHDDDGGDWAECATFSLRPSSHPSYFPGRRADILLQRLGAKEPIVVGTFGILHPDVLSQFQIPYVCSALEINIEHFL